MSYFPNNPNGQAAMADSAPVVIASDQSTLDVDTGLLQGLTDTELRATPVPISGTVTANAGTDLNTSALALDATLTDKSQFTMLTDGTDTALVTAAGEVNVLATAQPGVDIGDVTVNNGAGAAAVNIQDGGNSITVDGTVAFSNSSIAVTNAGTFAVQDAAAEASLSVLDDWDESDRAKVNIIVGQAGVAAGTGVDGATVQRVSLATDIPLPAGTNVIGHVIADSGSTTAVTQATASNLNATVVGTGTFAVQAAIADGADVTLGAKADAKSTATDTTAVTIMSVLKEISFMEQNPASRAVTNAGTFAVQEATLDAALIAQEATTSGVKGITAFGAVTTNAPSYTNAKSDALSLDTAGLLRVSLKDTPANTNKLLVTADAITIAAAQTLATVTTVSTVTNLSQMGGVAIALNTGAVSTGTQRVVLSNDAGKTLVSTGGSASSSGNNTLVAAGTNKLKVYAFSLSTTSTTAVTCIFQSGSSGTELWRVVLQAPTNVSTGANLVVQPPAYIFATAAATLLNLNLSGAQTVHWSVSYYDEA